LFTAGIHGGRKEKGRFTRKSLARDRQVVPEHAGALRPNFVAVNSIQRLRPENRQSEEGRIGNAESSQAERVRT